MDEEVKKMLDDHEKRISALEKIFAEGRKQTTKKGISIKEFILAKRPDDDVQKTLVIGYYLEKYEGLDSFNAKDLEDGFRTAKETVPKNINDKVNLNIKNGHMMEAKEKKDNRKAWLLTASGERYIEHDFKKE
jgi:hypothetical protein